MRSRWHKIGRQLVRSAVGGVILLLLSWYVVPRFVPLPDRLVRADESLRVLDRDGKALHIAAIADEVKSLPVSYDGLPEHYVKCVVAAEDKRFFDHGGIDPIAIGRALRDRVSGKGRSGASTITQQLAKWGGESMHERGLWQKLQEAFVARRLELEWDKERIFTEYVSRIDYGNRRRGVAAAARYYFGVDVSELTLAQSALLAALPRAPSRLDPRKNLERAKQRQLWILDRYEALYEQSDLVERAREEVLEFAFAAPPQSGRQWLAAHVDGSGEVTTTLDGALQNAAEESVARVVASLADRGVRQASALAVHVPTGEVLALVPSADFGRNGGIDGTRIPRSPGSTLKPFTYLLAIEEEKWSTGQLLADVPTAYRTAEGLDAPVNYDRRYRGAVTMRQALGQSLNLPAMRALNVLGGPKVLADGLKRMGQIDIDAETHGLGLTIGNAPLTLFELCTAYLSLARLGESGALTLVPRELSDGERVAGPAPTYLIADMLSDREARYPMFDPGNPLELPFRAAAKTGTSSDFRDNWCIGYTPDILVGVWMGNFDNAPTDQVSGTQGAARIWNDIMQAAHQGLEPRWYARPPGIIEIAVDRRLGKVSPEGDPELALEGYLPPVASRVDYDEFSRPVLDARFANWLASLPPADRARWARRIDDTVREAMRVVAPAQGATYLLDPDLPNAGRLRLRTRPEGVGDFTSETLEIVNGEAILVAGEHSVTVRDVRDGSSVEVTFCVQAL